MYWPDISAAWKFGVSSREVISLLRRSFADETRYQGSSQGPLEYFTGSKPAKLGVVDEVKDRTSDLLAGKTY